MNGTQKVDPHTGFLFSYEKRGFYGNCTRTLITGTSLSNRPGAGASRAVVTRPEAWTWDASFPFTFAAALLRNQTTRSFIRRQSSYAQR